jgi:hypothetical protein
MTSDDLQRIVDDAHVGMSAHGRNALTGAPVERLPPRLWDALRIELQRRYRNATGEEFAVLAVETLPAPQTPLQAGGENRLLAELKREAGVLALMNEQYTARAIRNIIAEFEKKFPTSEQQASGLAFPIGSRVRKVKGSSWQGVVVGTYHTALTPIGYAVESEREPGSVQIYPEAALGFVTAEVQP